MNKLPIYELKVSDDETLEIALVDEPAIEENFIFFNSDEIKMTFNDEQMIVSGPVLVPNLKIFVNDALGMRYVFFSKETIKDIAEKFLSKKGLKFNLQHTDKVAHLNIVESYFAKEGNTFGVPEGSWIVTAKVKDADVWESVKEGKFNGFSLQALVTNEIVGIEQQFNKQKERMDLKEKLMAAVNAVLFTEETPAVEEKVEEVVVEKVEFNADELISAFKETLESFKAGIVADVTAQIDSIKGNVENLSNQVVEFSKQPVSASVTEEVKVDLPVKDRSKATEFFKN